MSQMGFFLPGGSGPGGIVETLTGNSGGAVGPTGNNINILGAGAVAVAGNPGISTLTITVSGGSFTWNDVTTTSATMAAQNGYVPDNAGLVTLTMPTNSAFGDTIKVVGKGSGGWTIVYGAGQSIKFGASTTTVTTGSLSSTNANDCLELICTTASATVPIFTVASSIGNITVV